MSDLEFRALGLGLRVWGLLFGVSGISCFGLRFLGFKVQDLAVKDVRF